MPAGAIACCCVLSFRPAQCFAKPRSAPAAAREREGGGEAGHARGAGECCCCPAPSKKQASPYPGREAGGLGGTSLALASVSQPAAHLTPPVGGNASPRLHRPPRVQAAGRPARAPTRCAGAAPPGRRGGLRGQGRGATLARRSLPHAVSLSSLFLSCRRSAGALLSAALRGHSNRAAALRQ